MCKYSLWIYTPSSAFWFRCTIFFPYAIHTLICYMILLPSAEWASVYGVNDCKTIQWAKWATQPAKILITWSRGVTASIVCLYVCFALFCFSYFWFAILLETPAVTWRAYHNWPFNIFTSAGYSRVSFLSSFVWSFVSNPAGEQLRLSFHLFCARLCIFLHDFRPHSWLTDKKSWCNYWD